MRIAAAAGAIAAGLVVAVLWRGGASDASSGRPPEPATCEELATSDELATSGELATADELAPLPAVTMHARRAVAPTESSALEPALAATIAVRLSNAGGEALEGTARFEPVVHVEPAAEPLATAVPRETPALVTLPAGRWTAAVTSPGHRDATSEFEALPGEVRELSFVLWPVESTLGRGRIVGPDGAPLEQAVLRRLLGATQTEPRARGGSFRSRGGDGVRVALRSEVALGSAEPAVIDLEQSAFEYAVPGRGPTQAAFYAGGVRLARSTPGAAGEPILTVDPAPWFAALGSLYVTLENAPSSAPPIVEALALEPVGRAESRRRVTLVRNGTAWSAGDLAPGGYGVRATSGTDAAVGFVRVEPSARAELELRLREPWSATVDIRAHDPTKRSVLAPAGVSLWTPEGCPLEAEITLVATPLGWQASIDRLHAARAFVVVAKHWTTVEPAARHAVLALGPTATVDVDLRGSAAFARRRAVPVGHRVRAEAGPVLLDDQTWFLDFDENAKASASLRLPPGRYVLECDPGDEPLRASFAVSAAPARVTLRF